MDDIAILGAGAFGTALAIALGAEGPVTLWARDPAAAAPSPRPATGPHLPGATLPATVTVTADLAAAAPAPILLLAVPMQALAGLVAQLSDHRGALVACCKGVDLATGLGPTGIIAQRARRHARAAHRPQLRRRHRPPPAHRADPRLRRRGPGRDLQHRLATPVLRLYLGTDTTGADSAARSRTSSPSPPAWPWARASARARAPRSSPAALPRCAASPPPPAPSPRR